MGNRPTEWTFAPGAIDIDVDPLSIAGAGCELIDAILGQRHPVRDSQLTADELRNCHHAVVEDRHLGTAFTELPANPCAGSCRHSTSAVLRGSEPLWAPCKAQVRADSVRSPRFPSALHPEPVSRTALPPRRFSRLGAPRKR